MQVLLVYRPEAAGDLDARHFDQPFDGVDVYGLYPDDAALGAMITQLQEAHAGWQFSIDHAEPPGGSRPSSA
jgi:hypothetical protein